MSPAHQLLAALVLASIPVGAVLAANDQLLPSGVRVSHLSTGSGASPKASDTVRVHYRGTLADGKEFDSSYKRNAPATFPLGRVIPCWTQGL